jgi:hypothetical protein
MAYTHEMLEYLDIDWFAIDHNGYVLQFASMGGIIPNSIIEYDEDNKYAKKFFKQVLKGYTEYIINPHLNMFEKFYTDKQLEQYSESAASFSKKGMYSFYKTDINVFDDKHYHLVTSPKSPLHMKDLPSDIQVILERTRFNGDVTKTHSINIEDIT